MWRFKSMERNRRRARFTARANRKEGERRAHRRKRSRFCSPSAPGRRRPCKKMASLKRLETEFPILDPDFRSFCALRGIFTGSSTQPPSLPLSWLVWLQRKSEKANDPRSGESQEGCWFCWKWKWRERKSEFWLPFCGVCLCFVCLFFLSFFVASVQDLLIHDLQSLAADAEQQPSSERFVQVSFLRDSSFPSCFAMGCRELFVVISGSLDLWLRSGAVCVWGYSTVWIFLHVQIVPCSGAPGFLLVFYMVCERVGNFIGRVSRRAILSLKKKDYLGLLVYSLK